MDTAIACVIAVLVLALLFGKRDVAAPSPLIRRVPVPVPDAIWDGNYYYVVPAIHHPSADETLALEDSASDARDDLDDGCNGD